MLPTGSLPSSLGVCGGGLHVSGWSCLGEILRQPGTRTKARSGAPSTRGGPTPLWAQTWAKPSGISSSAPPPLPPAAGLDLGPAPPVSPRGKWTGTEKDLTPFLVPFPTAWGGGRDEGGGGSLHPQPQHPEPGEESFPTTLLCPGGCLLSRTRCPSAEAGSSEGEHLSPHTHLHPATRLGHCPLGGLAAKANYLVCGDRVASGHSWLPLLPSSPSQLRLLHPLSWPWLWPMAGPEDSWGPTKFTVIY